MLHISNPIPDAVSEAPFYISATGTSNRPRRTLKHGDSFVVLDSHGDIGATAGGPDGLFSCDTRYLSQLQLLLNGMPPLLLGSNLRDDNSVLSVDLTNPDIYHDQRIILRKDTLHIVRTCFLWNATAYQRLGLTNHGEMPLEIKLSLTFSSDFADLFEVRGLRRARRGVARKTVLDGHAVRLRYHGLDDKSRCTTLLFSPLPTGLLENVAEYHLTLEPKQSYSIFLSVGCADGEQSVPTPFFEGMLAARRSLKAATRHAATVQTSSDVFNEVLCRSMADLYMLMTDTPEGPYPYAGIPWYSTAFGRDGLITAMQMLWFDPRIARGVLRRLAAYQAKSVHDDADAQPGKILHEMRGGEMAALHEVPFGLYYGSVDSTPLFVMLAGMYTERTGDDETLAALWPAIEAALAWMDGPGDPDRDGFTEYGRMTEQGLLNQGWKDSHDAVFDQEGRLAEGPIALAEVQGYVYAAKLFAARCARRLGQPERAASLEAAARNLAERFETYFWCQEIGTYALALDGEKKPCRVQTSNAGQLLFTEMIRPDRAAQLADHLMRPKFFSGWGVRTVATTERRYNPMSYHNGSIWPHDNALIALGLARYGLKEAVGEIFQGQFDAAAYMDLRRLPELFCGFQRRRGRGPTLYPVACAPQAWASGAPFMLLKASLGLEFDHAHNEVRLRNPTLPKFLDHVILRNLRLGNASIDLVVHGRGDYVSVEILRTQGTVNLSVLGGAANTAGARQGFGPGDRAAW